MNQFLLAYLRIDSESQQIDLETNRVYLWVCAVGYWFLFFWLEILNYFDLDNSIDFQLNFRRFGENKFFQYF